MLTVEQVDKMWTSCSTSEEAALTDEAMPRIAVRVRTLRLRQGMSAQVLANACADRGVSSLTRSAIAKIESGLRKVSDAELEVLAEALGVSAADLLLPRTAADADERSAGPSVTRAPTAESVARDVVADLKVLRKGRGIWSGDLGARLGLALRTACDVKDDDNVSRIRQKVAHTITRLADNLPADLKVAGLAAFGIAPGAQSPLYQDRVNWVANNSNRDPRTVRRRIDEAIEHLAQLATSSRAEAADSSARATVNEIEGYRVDHVQLTLILDREFPEVFEQYSITAEKDQLAEIVASTVVPAESKLQMIYGGRLVSRFDPLNNRRFITFPQMLRTGDNHQYTLQYRANLAEGGIGFVVYKPERQCIKFDLHVRFDHDNLPWRVSLLDGVDGRDIASRVPRGQGCNVDAAGEIHLSFRHLDNQLAYGARWDW
jgi:transcriptional regulator with XRE-family HTH domain